MLDRLESRAEKLTDNLIPDWKKAVDNDRCSKLGTGKQGC